MKISLLKKVILVIVPIGFISFCLFWFYGWKSYGKIMQVQEALMQVPKVKMQGRKHNAGPGGENAGPRKQ